MSTPLERLAAAQGPDGGFDSRIDGGPGPDRDRNGFTAALVLRALRHVPAHPAIDAVRRRALDFVAGCECPRVPGAYSFWPARERPAWARDVPADVDDTAIIALELHRHGRLDRSEALRSLAVLLPQRVGAADAGLRPAWIATGSFHAWIGAAPGRQVVDCCVNANVAALMARLGARALPGYVEAIRTVADGLAWAGRDPVRLDSLTPFYPSPHALREAVAHAVECGARELVAASLALDSLAPGVPPRSAGCCRSAYGRTTWHCAALDAARGVAARPAIEEGRVTCRS